MSLAWNAIRCGSRAMARMADAGEWLMSAGETLHYAATSVDLFIFDQLGTSDRSVTLEVVVAMPGGKRYVASAQHEAGSDASITKVWPDDFAGAPGLPMKAGEYTVVWRASTGETAACSGWTAVLSDCAPERPGQ